MQPPNSEKGRINLLLQRDGLEAARNWVERTLNNYRKAIASPANHASQKNYKPLFEQSIEEFEQWLSTHPETISKEKKPNS
ncbi:hypothetical protein [Nitrosococcus watsonii]|uniref:Uncharacterized protein n=1 Tax=Nitrosococcus watsoni (strain C-113) TaxID=105559 RepID=D8K769_NITWC|nr:hypothetical protein [Nitrosococcus watsonii]ADJ28746.1 hypothetical protein Nwat_1900 [Nitrosococcus watsonii C-113]